MHRHALFLLALFATAETSAAPITIVNASFEDAYQGADVAAGTFPVGPAPNGWTVFDPDNVVGGGVQFVGVLNPAGSTFFAGGSVPDGDNAALLYTGNDTGGFAYGIEQSLGTPLLAGTLYTLTVEVGNIATGTGVTPPYDSFGEFDLRGFPGYRIELRAGTELLVADHDSLGGSIPDGEFGTSVIQYLAGPGAPLGQELSIRLINLNQPDIAGVSGLEVDFDHVRLDASPAAIPVPGVLWLMDLAGLGLAATRRR